LACTQESKQTFDYLLTHPEYSFWEKWAAHLSGSVVMCAVAKMRKRKYLIDDVRKALYSALDDMVACLGTSKFLGGESPNEADLNIYGILRSISGFKTEEDITTNTGIGEWLTRMKAAVGETQLA